MPNHDTIKWSSENLLATEMNKAEVKMDKPVYLRLPVLVINNRAMYENWYDYMKSKYGEKIKLCNTDMESFIFHIKYESIYTGHPGEIKERPNTSNYEVERPLPMVKNSKVIVLM